jgi:hypothetical protein
MLTIPSTETGSILLTGYESQMQNILGRQIVAEHLANNGSVVSLCAYEDDAKAQTIALTDTLRGLKIDKSVLKRFTTLERAHHYKDADTLQFSVDKTRVKNHDLLVIREWSGMLELRPGDPWLVIASELALLLQGPVWTFSHHGRVGPPAPRYSDFQGDAVWSAQAGLNLSLVLNRHVPSKLTVKLTGRMLEGNQLAFENVEEEANAA